ncbi:MAG: Plug domain-containing protein, partial [Rikenellaceae bacterium]|nr:Plug domain-containing protein [Rikenellaceae bacterium]
SGRVKILASRKWSVGTPVYMVMPRTGYFQVEETDQEGRFAFSGYEVPDSGSFFLQAVNKRGNNKVELLLDDDFEPLSLPALPGPAHAAAGPSEFAYIAKADQKWVMENGMRTVNMEAVEVRGSRSQDPFMDAQERMADNVFDEQYFEEYVITDFESLLYTMPGVNYDGDSITIRGSSVGFVIDDVPAWEGFDWKTDINLFDVEKVLVFRGPTGQAFYGGPTIAVYLKKGAINTSSIPSYNRLVIHPLGVQKPIEFYAPTYENPEQRNRRVPDLRTTIYWNPSLQTDSGGQAVFEFYTADGANTTYSVVIEGITEDGRIIRTVEQLQRSGL